LQYVRKIEAITNDAVAALAPFGGQEGIELSIGASHTVAVYLLPKPRSRTPQCTGVVLPSEIHPFTFIQFSRRFGHTESAG
jgi:hypothetical protein